MGAYASAMVTAADREAEVARKYELLSPYLDERQQRLWMGTEAREGGHGGVSVVARAAGVARSTVTRGLFELEGGEELAGRARRPGGGRKRAGVADPGLAGALRALVEPDARGDPGSPLQWTTKSVRTLADELTAAGHKVSPPTVARLLKDEGFSLQANVLALGPWLWTPSSATSTARRPLTRPPVTRVISVDAKKKELGRHEQEGRAHPGGPKGQPEKVNVHDFIDKELGKVTPYGVYDMAANSGWVTVGTDHDTAQFGASTIRTWWDKAGRPARTRRHPAADHRRWRRLERVPDPAVEDRAGPLRRRDRAAGHGVPPPARHLQVEQGGAPAVLPHLHGLARPAADQPRGDRGNDRRDHDPHRAVRHRRARHQRVPQGHQDQRPADEGAGEVRGPSATCIPWRMELHAHPRQPTARVIF